VEGIGLPATLARDPSGINERAYGAWIRLDISMTDDFAIERSKPSSLK
jgi:hypothetical protein